MRRLALGLLLLLAVAPPGVAGAGDAATDRMLAAIRAGADEVKTLRADLVQEKHLKVFDEVLLSTGHFAFAKPDRLRWEIVDPVRTGFSIRGREGTRWHEMTGAPQPFSIDDDPMMGAVAEQLMAWATADFDRLEKGYVLEVSGENPARIRMVPRSEAMAQYVEAVEVRFDPSMRNVDEVTVREAGGDFTRIRFTGVEVNAALPEDAF